MTTAGWVVAVWGAVIFVVAPILGRIADAEGLPDIVVALGSVFWPATGLVSFGFWLASKAKGVR